MTDPRLEAELAAIDDAARALPVPPRPPGLDAAVLAAVARTPQDRPEPANRAVWPRRLLFGLAAAAAVALVVTVGSARDEAGDPAHFVAKGPTETPAAVDGLRAAVRAPDGALGRLDQGASYPVGSRVLFRVDLASAASLHLVRVDHRGAALLHVESGSPGTADLATDGVPLGYELEEGEGRAVFAVLSTQRRLTASELATLPAGGDAEAVCAAAVALDAFCDAVTVGAVR
jgi:hypothetical protein